jgi:hypothetical protein
MYDDTQVPLRILALVGILATATVLLIMLLQVFTEGLIS